MAGGIVRFSRADEIRRGLSSVVACEAMLGEQHKQWSSGRSLVLTAGEQVAWRVLANSAGPGRLIGPPGSYRSQAQKSHADGISPNRAARLQMVACNSP